MRLSAPRCQSWFARVLLRMLFRTVAIAGFFLASCVSSIAQGRDTVINARYVLRAVLADPGQQDRMVEHDFTITLRSTGVTQRHQTGGLSGPPSPVRQLVLGGDSQSNVQYRVVDADTIERVLNNQTFVSTMTAKVSGNTCRLSYRMSKKPGHKYIVAAGYRGGTAGRFRSFTMLGQHCEIR